MKSYPVENRWSVAGQSGRRMGRRTGTLLTLGVILLVSIAVLVASGPRFFGSAVGSGSVAAPDLVQAAGQAAPAVAPEGQPTGWTRPQAGWLYVLDTNDLREAASVLLVDPATGVVKGRIPTGYAPDMALSPDGTRLYVASQRQGGRLDVIDTATGAVLRTVEIPDRQIYALLPVWSRMAISPDGRWLYVNQMRFVAPGADEYSVATFDTQRGRFLPERAPIPGCPSALLIPYARQGSLAVFCGAPGATQDARFLQPEQNGLLAEPSTLPIAGQLAGAIWSGTTSTIYQVAEDGRVVLIDGAARRVSRTVALELPGGGQVVKGSVALSADGARLYLGVRQPAGRKLQARQILVVDTATWQALRTIPTSQPFGGLAVSRDGRRLQALNPDGDSLLILDAAEYRERAVIGGLGDYPGLMLVAP